VNRPVRLHATPTVHGCQAGRQVEWTYNTDDLSLPEAVQHLYEFEVWLHLRRAQSGALSGTETPPAARPATQRRRSRVRPVRGVWYAVALVLAWPVGIGFGRLIGTLGIWLGVWSR
jgi:hypothetical protein